MFDLQYFSYIIIFILRSFPHPNYNLNSDIDCCDTQLTALIFKSKDWLAQWQDIISKCNPFWDSKPELFSDIACLQIPYQPCIVLFGKKLQVPPPRTGVKLRLHLIVVPTGAGVFKSRHILLHKYVNRIMITYLWCQIQLIIPSLRFRSIAILTCFESMSRDRFSHYVV